MIYNNGTEIWALLAETLILYCRLHSCHELIQARIASADIKFVNHHSPGLLFLFFIKLIAPFYFTMSCKYMG